MRRGGLALNDSGTKRLQRTLKNTSHHIEKLSVPTAPHAVVPITDLEFKGSH